MGRARRQKHACATGRCVDGLRRGRRAAGGHEGEFDFDRHRAAERLRLIEVQARSGRAGLAQSRMSSHGVWWSTGCGLRISEAIKLERQDVDFNRGLLTIRQAKFNKTRLIPLHISTREVFTQYAARRDRLMPRPASPCFLLNDYGRRLELSAVHRTFYDLSRQMGLRGPADHTGPRLHDFGHRFALKI